MLGRAHTMKLKHVLFLGALASLLSGCGGGGGGGGSAATGTTRLFLTDGLDNNQQVWVKVYQVRLDSTVVFDDSVGKVIDVRALSDATGKRFSLLNTKDIPAGSYSTATVVVDKSFVVFPVGATFGTNKQFSDDGGGKHNILVNFAPAVSVVPGSSNVVLDFDLASWTDGATVTPVVKRNSDDTGINDVTRHEAEDYSGTVASLAGTSPVQTFTMNSGGGTVNVSTTAATVIYTQAGATSPALANGTKVEVFGTYNTTTGNLEASKIKIEDESGHENDAEVKGMTANADPDLKTFEISVDEAHSFVPGKSIYTVVTNSSTTYRSASGAVITAADFFGLWVDGMIIEVEGSVDGSGNFAARKVKIDNSGGDGTEDNIEIKGSPSNLNSNAETLTIALTEWSGFSGSAGKLVNVITDGSVIYYDKNGDSIDSDTFFTSAATAGMRVEAEGHWSGTSLLVSKLKLDK